MRMMTPYWSNRSFASDLFNEVDRLFGANLQTAYDERSFHPQCDITETDEHFLMSVDLPGINKDDIKIDLTENLLTISGERKSSFQSDGKVQRYEKSYGFFKRSFSLPSTLDTEAIEAKYENGVLELYLPKTQKAKPRQVEIKTTSEGIFKKLLGKTTSEPPANT